MLWKADLKIHVHSAGTEAFPGRRASLRILHLLKKEEIDLSAHWTRKISREIVDEACIIFVMEKAHREAILELAPQMEGRVFLLSQFYSEREILPMETEIPDPIGMDNFFYENVNDIIKDCCQRVLSRFKNKLSATIPLEMQTLR